MLQRLTITLALLAAGCVTPPPPKVAWTYTPMGPAGGASPGLINPQINEPAPPEEPQAPCSPADVARAIEQIATLARLTIREATLVLDSEPLVDYRKV